VGSSTETVLVAHSKTKKRKKKHLQGGFLFGSTRKRLKGAHISKWGGEMIKKMIRMIKEEEWGNDNNRRLNYVME